MLRKAKAVEQSLSCHGGGRLNEGRPNARVKTSPKCQMIGRTAVELKLTRVREAIRVAVSDIQHQDYALIRLDGTAVDGHLSDGLAKLSPSRPGESQ